MWRICAWKVVVGLGLGVVLGWGGLVGMVRGEGLQWEYLGEWPGETRGTYRDAVLLEDGKLVVAAEWGGLQVFDLSVPGEPRRLGEWNKEAKYPVAISGYGDRVLVADNKGWMSSWDLGNPAGPRSLWETKIEGNASRTPLIWPVVVGRWAVLANNRGTTSAQLEVWDLEDPSAPVRRAEVSLGDNSFVHFPPIFEGTNAWIRAGSSNLFHLDLAEPEAPVLSVTLDLPIISSQGGHHLDGRRLLVSKGTTMSLIDLSQPASPRLLVSQRVPIGTNSAPDNIFHVHLRGNRACAITLYHLQVLDISNAASFEVLGTIPVAGRVSRVLGLGEHRLVVVTEQHGIQVFDLSDPRQPVLESTIGAGGMASRIEPYGNALYVADDVEMRILDAGDPGSLRWHGNVPQAGSNGGYQLARQDNGLVIYSFTMASLYSLKDPWAPERVHALRTSGPSARVSYPHFNVTWLNDRAVAVSDGLGLGLMIHPNVQSLAPGFERNSMLGSVPTVLGRGFQPNTLVVGQSNTVIIVHDGGMNTFRSDSLKWSVTLPFHILDLEGDGPFGHAYVVGEDGEFAVVDIRQPTSPRLVSTLQLPGRPRRVSVRWPQVFVGLGFDGVAVVDVFRPDQPRLVSAWDTPGEAWSVAVDGERLYVAEGARGVSEWRWWTGKQKQTIDPGPLLVRVTNMPPFALQPVSSRGLPVEVRILSGPLEEVDGMFRVTRQTHFCCDSQWPRGFVPVRLLMVAEGDATTDPAWLEAEFDVIPRPDNAYGRWMLERYPHLRAVDLRGTADPDGDGAMNRQEYAFGTDPTLAGAGHGRVPMPQRVWLDGSPHLEIEMELPPTLLATPWQVGLEMASSAAGPWEPMPEAWYEVGLIRVQAWIPVEEGMGAKLIRLRVEGM